MLIVNPVVCLLFTVYILSSSPVNVTAYDVFENAVPNVTDEVNGDPPNEALLTSPALPAESAYEADPSKEPVVLKVAPLVTLKTFDAIVILLEAFKIPPVLN